jgi:clan AA aspartic protease
MTGYVDKTGRVLIPLRVAAPDSTDFIRTEAWVDTGFNGELVLPMPVVQQLVLTQSACVTATLGDGQDVVLDVFSCNVEWFGEVISLDVIANQGDVPLIGFGLLKNHRLTVDYPGENVTIE